MKNGDFPLQNVSSPEGKPAFFWDPLPAVCLFANREAAAKKAVDRGEAQSCESEAFRMAIFSMGTLINK